MRATRGHQSGLTIVELTVALFLGLLVVLALGRIILASQSSWEQGRDKVVLQQNVTEALEGMARSIRAARQVVVVSSDQFETYDETGALVHTYAAIGSGASRRLQQDGVDFVDRQCVQFGVTPNADTTSLSILLELANPDGVRIGAETRAVPRNISYAF
ncbi:MAG: hypothetical protein KAY32_01030 [Candidatus Eisenbacteria sp.]|nr:hypothetical protein [Candidatus Eisenbacteria bacterium]